MYAFKIPQSQLKDLWRAREYFGKGSLALQVRIAVSNYLDDLEKEIGAPLVDVVNTIDGHERESIADEPSM